MPIDADFGNLGMVTRGWAYWREGLMRRLRNDKEGGKDAEGRLRGGLGGGQGGRVESVPRGAYGNTTLLGCTIGDRTGLEVVRPPSNRLMDWCRAYA